MWGDINKKLIRVCQDHKPEKIQRVAALLDQGANIDCIDQRSENTNGLTPLLIALQNGDEELAKYLIERGADIHSKGTERYNAFSLACSRRMPGIADILLAKGMDINGQDGWSKTPLMDACYNGSIEIVDFLLERKAEVNLRGSYGYTALHWAVSNNNVKAALRLIEKGADVNIVSNDGMTALMRAASGGNNHYEMIRLLLEHKTDTSIKNDSGQTAYELAKRQNNQKILGLFAEHQQNNHEGIRWEKVSNTSVKRNSIIDEQFSQLEHLDFQTRMYVTIIKDSSGKFSHASQPFNSVARATVEDAANFLRRNGGAPDLAKPAPHKPGKRDM